MTKIASTLSAVTLAGSIAYVLSSTQALAMAPPPAPPPNSDYVFMQFVAHEDDDTLFMNPDLENFLGAGYTTITVVLTGGEADGTVSESYPGCPSPPAESRSTFAASRQAGMRAAYAQMAGEPNVWTRTWLWLNGDNWAELDSLGGGTQVELIFLDLPDGGDDGVDGTAGCGGALACLYSELGAASFGTIAVDGAPQPSSTYARADLVSALNQLLRKYQPDVVRTLDPEPYQRYSVIAPGQASYAVGYDNLDHTATALFVNEALAQYPFIYQAQYYKGYSIAYHEGNLGASEYARKVATFDRYMSSGFTPYDPNALFYTCEQEEMGTYAGPDGAGSYPAWFGATYERYPGSSTWLTALPSGNLAAFAVLGRQLVSWQETTPGGSWVGPTPLGGGPLSPHVSTATLPSGDLAVFALQIPASDLAAGVEPSIVYDVLSASSSTWSGWTSLGNPADASPGVCGAGMLAPCRWTGEPVAAVDGAGNLVVFARNSEGHLSARVQQGGVFQPWQTMPDPVASGYDVLDGLAAITADDGTVHVFASTYQGIIVHAFQTAPGQATFAADIGGFPAGYPTGTAASAPTVTKNQDGRLQVFWHDAGTADVMTSWEEVGGGWAGAWDLGNTGTGGTGPIAAMRRTSGEILIFARNGYGGVSANWQASINAGFVGWSDLQNQVPAYPAGATDANGNAVVAIVGVDLGLHVRREHGGLGAFGGWTRQGN
jgi:LmbE family N-acetylglucosaminyl deacetylase